MIRKALILKLFSASYMQRWNDKLRPIELVEIDKHAHRMIIAYVIGKYHEKDPEFSWVDVIEGGLFELLQKVVLTDIKSPVLYRIKSDPEKYKKLNEFVFKELHPILSPFGKDFTERLEQFFLQGDDTVAKRILSAASTYASRWEFEIIKHSDPHMYDRDQIEHELEVRYAQYHDLLGVQALYTTPGLRRFIDLCGGLRFQMRWAGVHRVPKTSVLGHCFFVALLSYLFSFSVSACEKRCFLNFFTGLFHDFAEVLTRDIIAPVKHSVEGLSEFLLEYEKEQMEQNVYPFLPSDLSADMKLFTENEKQSIVLRNGKIEFTTSEEIAEKYNEDIFCSRDGEFIRLGDELGAFVEAYEAIRNGCDSERFQKAMWSIRTKYEQLGMYANIPVKELFMDF